MVTQQATSYVFMVLLLSAHRGRCPYVNFQGRAREAMEFVTSCWGNPDLQTANEHGVSKPARSGGIASRTPGSRPTMHSSSLRTAIPTTLRKSAKTWPLR